MAIEQAVILAGGLGTRMRPMTEQVPKPMLTVCGKPFLQHQIELLKSHGMRRILLLVAYLGEQIEQYFSNGSNFGVNIEYSYELSPLGTGGALKNAENSLDSEFVVLNGDTYLDVDYRRFFSDFKDCKCSAMTVAFENMQASLKNNLAFDADQIVTAYSKHNSAGLTHVDAGATALQKTVLKFIPSGRKCSLEEEIFSALIENKQLKAWPTQERFIDMGSAAGLAALEERLR